MRFLISVHQFFMMSANIIKVICKNTNTLVLYAKFTKKKKLPQINEAAS